MSPRLDAVIDQALGARIVGTHVIVLRQGRTVYDRIAGLADREAGRPVREDTVWRLASCTKPIVASAVLALADQGRLDLSAPVSLYLPDFRPRTVDGACPDITLMQLLTHTSGITYASPAGDVSRGLDPCAPMTLAENLRRLARSTLAFAPGTAWDYGLGIDVLAGVIAAVSGNVEDVEAALQAQVFGPLGMTDTHFLADPFRLAANYDNNTVPPRRFAPTDVLLDPGKPGQVSLLSTDRVLQSDRPQSGGAGLSGTARDYARFLHSAFFGPLLSPAARALAAQDQIPALDRAPDAPDQGFSALGATIRKASADWPVQGMLHWGGLWGHNWAVDPASQTVMVSFSNTTYEGCNGAFRTEVIRAIFG